MPSCTKGVSTQPIVTESKEHKVPKRRFRVLQTEMPDSSSDSESFLAAIAVAAKKPNMAKEPRQATGSPSSSGTEENVFV